MFQERKQFRLNEATVRNPKEGGERGPSSGDVIKAMLARILQLLLSWGVFILPSQTASNLARSVFEYLKVCQEGKSGAGVSS